MKGGIKGEIKGENRRPLIVDAIQFSFVWIERCILDEKDHQASADHQACADQLRSIY